MFGLVICVSAIIQKWKTCRTRDLCNLTLYRNGLHVGPRDLHLTLYRNDDGLVICISDIYRMDTTFGTRDLCNLNIIQNGFMLGLVICNLTLYRMTPCWTRDMCIWHYTWWCNVGTHDLCIWHFYRMTPMRSRVQHVVNSCIMADTQITSPTCLHFCIMSDTLGTSWSVHLTLYRMDAMLDLVICVSDIIQKWRHVGLVICVSAIIQELTTCWTRDLCIWHYTEWLHVGPCDSCIWHYTEWTPMLGLMICFI